MRAQPQGHVTASMGRLQTLAVFGIWRGQGNLTTWMLSTLGGLATLENWLVLFIKVEMHVGRGLASYCPVTCRHDRTAVA